MDRKNILSRRTLLKAAPAVIAAAPVMTASAHAEAIRPEYPGDRLSRLMQEISEILDTALFGTFCAVIEPSRHDRAIVALKPISEVRKAWSLAQFVEKAPPQALVDYHLMGAAKAMQKLHGGAWVARSDAEGNTSLSQDPSMPDGAWVSYPTGDVL